MKVPSTNKMTKTMPFGWMISAMVFYICLYYYIYQSHLESQVSFLDKFQSQIFDNLAETWEERQLEDRKLQGQAAKKKVPQAGCNFASAPIDRENIAENVQNSQFCSTQACNYGKKRNRNF